MEAYMAMGDVPAQKDRLAKWDEIREHQKIIIGTLKAMNRAFPTGIFEGGMCPEPGKPRN